MLTYEDKSMEYAISKYLQNQLYSNTLQLQQFVSIITPFYNNVKNITLDFTSTEGIESINNNITNNMDKIVPQFDSSSVIYKLKFLQETTPILQSDPFINNIIYEDKSNNIVNSNVSDDFMSLFGNNITSGVLDNLNRYTNNSKEYIIAQNIQMIISSIQSYDVEKLITDILNTTDTLRTIYRNYVDINTINKLIKNIPDFLYNASMNINYIMDYSSFLLGSSLKESFNPMYKGLPELDLFLYDIYTSTHRIENETIFFDYILDNSSKYKLYNILGDCIFKSYKDNTNKTNYTTSIFNDFIYNLSTNDISSLNVYINNLSFEDFSGVLKAVDDSGYSFIYYLDKSNNYNNLNNIYNFIGKSFINLNKVTSNFNDYNNIILDGVGQYTLDKINNSINNFTFNDISNFYGDNSNSCVVDISMYPNLFDSSTNVLKNIGGITNTIMDLTIILSDLIETAEDTLYTMFDVNGAVSTANSKMNNVMASVQNVNSTVNNIQGALNKLSPNMPFCISCFLSNIQSMINSLIQTANAAIANVQGMVNNLTAGINGMISNVMSSSVGQMMGDAMSTANSVMDSASGISSMVGSGMQMSGGISAVLSSGGSSLSMGGMMSNMMGGSVGGMCNVSTQGGNIGSMFGSLNSSMTYGINNNPYRDSSNFNITLGQFYKKYFLNYIDINQIFSSTYGQDFNSVLKENIKKIEIGDLIDEYLGNKTLLDYFTVLELSSINNEMLENKINSIFNNLKIGDLLDNKIGKHESNIYPLVDDYLVRGGTYGKLFNNLIGDKTVGSYINEDTINSDIEFLLNNHYGPGSTVGNIVGGSLTDNNIHSEFNSITGKSLNDVIDQSLVDPSIVNIVKTELNASTLGEFIDSKTNNIKLGDMIDNTLSGAQMRSIIFQAENGYDLDYLFNKELGCEDLDKFIETNLGTSSFINFINNNTSNSSISNIIDNNAKGENLKNTINENIGDDIDKVMYNINDKLYVN